jgi:predicted PurR-regulated permease PerM
MLDFVLAANPILAMFGQIAAIVICIFVLIFVLLAIAFNVLMSFTMAWVHEKVDLIKMLRPTVESLNKASESVSQGIAPTANENIVVRKVASLPANMHAIDEKVQQSTGRVANAVIEFRARTVQVQTVVKAFLLPGLTRRRPVIPTGDGAKDLKGPQAWMVIEEPSSQGVKSAPISAGPTQ